MAFSIASAPVENRAVRFSKSPGVCSLSQRHTSVNESYSVTMKQVCVNLASWSPTRACTLGLLAPTLVTAMPEAKSTMRFPSTS